MKLLALVSVAAMAAWVAPAMAQTVPDPDPYYGVGPNKAPPPHARPTPHAGVEWHGPAQQQRGYAEHRMGPGPMMGQAQRRGDYRRMERGGVVPQRWWRPEVQVRDWHRYGFPQPFEGGRWIRYYDDALLIDGNGRVYDSRPGWDWNRGGERWDQDGDGVPVYAGNGDYQPRGRDYEWAERYENEQGGPPPGVRQRSWVEQAPMGRPMGPPPCGSCGGGYGAAYMGYGPVMVTETTITEAPVVEQRTYVSYETVRVRVHHRRHVVHRCGCRVAAPPPPPGGGERG